MRRGHSPPVQGGASAQASLCVDAAEGEVPPGARWTAGVMAVVPGFAGPPVNALTAAQTESSSRSG